MIIYVCVDTVKVNPPAPFCKKRTLSALSFLPVIQGAFQI